MSELLRIKTGVGAVTVTETNVILDKPGGMASEMVSRASITRVDDQMVIPALFGMGGAHDVTLYSSDGRRLVLRTIKPADAKALLALLR